MLDKLMGVVTLKVPTYRALAEDKTATTQAAIIVVIATLIRGFFEGLVKLNPQTGAVSTSVGGAIVGAIIAVVLGLIGWVISAWVLAFVANALGGKTDTSEMLRVTGFVEVFSVVAILNILALFGSALTCILGLIAFIAGILKLIGYVIGVREAAEFDTVKAIITAIIAAIVNFLIVVTIGGAITAALLGVLAIAG